MQQGSTPTTRRLAALRQAMAQRGLDAFIIYERPNAFYFSGFACSNSLVVVGEKQAVFLTDFRYLEAAEAQIRELNVQRMTQNGSDELAQVLRQIKPKRIGFEGSVPCSRYMQYKSVVRGGKLEQAGELIGHLRQIKDSDEIACIAKNQKINEAVLRLALQQVSLGTSELDIRRQIRAEMNRRDVEEAFDTIAALGANTSLPHAVPSAQRAEEGEFLLLDMGVRRDHYHSDMTRTFCIGQPASPLQREIYSVVLEAQEAGLAALRAGIACREVDEKARQVIASAGYAEYFGHGLGHGVGLEIHEGPTLNPRSQQVLEEGMVVTVEPGIYLPGLGGVRIEDLVVVTRDGYENLTSAPKRFRSLRPEAR